jgi:hypothetical protein
VVFCGGAEGADNIPAKSSKVLYERTSGGQAPFRRENASRTSRIKGQMLLSENWGRLSEIGWNPRAYVTRNKIKNECRDCIVASLVDLGVLFQRKE